MTQVRLSKFYDLRFLDFLTFLVVTNDLPYGDGNFQYSSTSKITYLTQREVDGEMLAFLEILEYDIPENPG
jgi:hypothetical protein